MSKREKIQATNIPDKNPNQKIEEELKFRFCK
jgi:hypothetical protein